MERLVTSWCNYGASPQSYICPPETRPGKVAIPSSGKVAIPIINLGEALINRNDTIINVLKATQKFGFFQAVSHGVSEKLSNDTMKVVAEFFEMLMEVKASLYSEDPNNIHHALYKIW
ncbi:putative 2-oxoglutarate and Fe(II)-dependent oxygenase superfamily protein [Hibiscus syriacus]|uniref:2-oxoglutarate and Fe(II)-dependent oxygenase superfamily protein n=1 Tax=Hibiscus syriacus TaxID=106335 RepID=A0A6A2ZZE2_HIBSY|nr:putative 2-oxoglutarate and Fe(II)-dependent oxygenase superfamily protein [Hibiscus syriacus]